MSDKPGYYVEDVSYGHRIAQARGRAKHLANEYGRPVEIINEDHDGVLTIIETHHPKGGVKVETPPRPVGLPSNLMENVTGGFRAGQQTARD